MVTKQLDDLVDWMRKRGVLQLVTPDGHQLVLGEEPQAAPEVVYHQKPESIEELAEKFAQAERRGDPEDIYDNPDLYPDGVVPTLRGDDE